MNFVNHVQEKGVVGAGGAGFPSHIKLQKSAEIVLVNAAECEPLLHKDKQILEHFAPKTKTWKAYSKTPYTASRQH